MPEIIIFIIKFIILIAILAMFYSFINSIDSEAAPNEVKKETFSCDLDKLDIDEMVIINRNPEYIKYINKLIDDKSFMFTDKQLQVLKNPNQFYNVDKNNDDTKNISYKIYNDCKGQIDSPIGLTNGYLDGVNKGVVQVDNAITHSDLSSEENLEINSSNEYNKIIKKFEENIANTIKPDCVNSCVMSDPKYLKNYYQDVYGNKIQSTLTDYFADYYTNINTKEPKEAIPVITLISGNSNFIIPDQYSIQNLFTNAYNVDWSRVVNPYTIY